MNAVIGSTTNPTEFNDLADETGDAALYWKIKNECCSDFADSCSLMKWSKK